MLKMRPEARTRRKIVCGHSDHYLTYAVSKETKIARRAMACRNCNSMILIPTYMIILNDMNADKVEYNL